MLQSLAAIGITGPLALDVAAQSGGRLSSDTLRRAAAILGEEFSDERLGVIEKALQRSLDQFQVVRGGKDFASCMKKYAVGSRAPVFVKHWWDERGYFAWDVYMVGDCLRYIEESSAGSYEKVQECSDDDMYGKITGFACRRRSFERMATVCPWLAR